MSAVAPRTLPDPAIDPADVQAVLPELTLEQATLAAQLATVVVQGAIWPSEIPAPPPPPVYGVLLGVAVRAGLAIMQGSALPVVSESLGSYSYRLATPSTLAGLRLSEDELVALEPWIAGGSCYDVSVVGAAWTLPIDWWQRNLEQPLDGPYDALTVAEGDARYSQLGHRHADVRSAVWTFATATLAEDPGRGRVRLNAAVPADATELYLSGEADDGTDYARVLAQLVAGDGVGLQDRDDATLAQRYVLAAAAVDEVGWLRLPIAWESASEPPLVPANNQPLLVAVYVPAAP